MDQEAVRQMIARVIQGVMRAAGDVAAAGNSRVYERLAYRGVFDGEEAVRAMVAAVFQRVVHSDSVAVDVDTGAVHFFVANGPQKSAMEGLVHSMLSGILERIVAASEVQVMGSRILGEMEGDGRDLAEILRAVEAGGEVHSMVSKVFEEVVAGNEDANPDHDHDHLEHEVLTSSFDKLALEGCDEELTAATAPLVHYMVSNIVRKVIEARDERGHAGEEERYRKESSDVQAIVRLCREKSVRLAKEVPAFFDAMAYFQLRAGSLLNPEMSSPGVAEDSSKDFLDGCVQRLLREDCPAQETIRLQISAQAAMDLELKGLKMDADRRKAVLKDMAKCVAEVQINDLQRTFQIVEDLHSRVLRYVLHFSKEVEEKMTVASITENRAALESIFPQATCISWIDHPKAEKAIQVEEMAAAVTGIRVFNKSLGRGGQGFELPFGHYKDEMKSLGERVMDCLQKTNEKAQRCAEAIRLHLEPLGMRHVLLQRLRDELAYYLQAFALLEGLQNVLTERFGIVREYDDKCCEHLRNLYETIECRSCIANELVYPQFQAVGTIVKSVGEELRVLRAYARASIPLLSLASQPLFAPTPSGIANICSSTGLSKLNTLVNYTTFLPPEVYTVDWHENDVILSKVGTQQDLRCGILRDEDVENALQGGGALQLSGYCPVALAKHRGLLLHGDPDIGLVHVEGKLYAFSSEEALNQ